MGTTQKYSLKWNDFTVNVASTFRDLHSRHDFVDVTLACADGTTLEAHKVILSSVSQYFRDILKTTPCKHPIIILKDTSRAEAQAMLEFAYTGEVNVAQELLPHLLLTARQFRIKGLDKVESPLGEPQPPPPPPPSHPHPSASLLAAAAASGPLPLTPVNGTEHWEGSNGSQPVLPGTAPVAPLIQPPSLPQQPSADVKPPVNFSNGAAQAGAPPSAAAEHFLSGETKPGLATAMAAGAILNMNGRREREVSPPHSLPNSQPPTRESSPCPTPSSSVSNNSRTPPPKRWKRSFDMTQPPPHSSSTPKSASSGANAPPAIKECPEQQEPLPMVAENYSTSRPADYEPNKRSSNGYCEPSSNTGSGRPNLSYSHSMPTSPTMFEKGHEVRLHGLFRAHLTNNDSGSSSRSSPVPAHSGSHVTSSSVGGGNSSVSGNGAPTASAASSSSSNQTPNSSQQRPDSIQHSNSADPVDYRCFSNQAPKVEPKTEPDYTLRNGSSSAAASSSITNSRPCSSEATAAANGDRYRRNSLFRPESAPTVLDMSPEGSLSGPPSVRSSNVDLSDAAAHHIRPNAGGPNGSHRPDDDEEEEEIGHHDELSDCVSKAFNMQPDAAGCYSCDECGKSFRHPGSLQHHRHIHRGTHRCPSCGKAFSRRWDMERHLNKSKYGCPANRFSTGSAGSTGSSGSSSGVHNMSAPGGGGPGVRTPTPSNTHLELLSAATAVNVNLHNTTA